MKMKRLSPALMGYSPFRPSPVLRSTVSSWITGVRGKSWSKQKHTSQLSYRGERFRVADDRLEILDGEGAIMLVFDRVAPLPGRPVDLRGTSWRLISADDVDNDLRVTTMIFNGRQVTGSTACGDYLRLL